MSGSTLCVILGVMFIFLGFMVTVTHCNQYKICMDQAKSVEACGKP